MEIKESEGCLHFSGKGVEVLRLKSDIAARIGSDLVQTRGRDRFSIPLESLSLVSDLLPYIEASQSLINRIQHNDSLHKEASKIAEDILKNEDEGNPIPPWKSVLDHYQSVAVNIMTLKGLKGLCLFDEQGAGKTVMALATFDSVKESEEIDAMMVACPKSMMKEWAAEVQRFLPGKYKVTIVEGDAMERYKLTLTSFDVLIINYESVPRLLIALASIAGSRRTLLVVDESYYIKNPRAIRSTAIRSLRRKCIRGIVLCGTPAPNNATDLVHQFNVADDGYTYAGYEPSGDLIKDRPKIVEAMETRGLYLRRLKRQILPNLPEKQFEIIAVPLTGRQAELYKEARDSLVLWLKGMDNKIFQKNLSGYYAKRHTLLQICVCPIAIDTLFDEMPSKLFALDDLFNDLITKKNRKVVLWSFYRRSLDDAYNRYKHFGLVRVDGSTAGPARRDAIERFQKDNTVNIFLGNPAAIGAGVTLHAAAEAVYLSYPSQAAHYLQSLDRIHRRGQKASEVRYHLLVCRNTIEEGEVSRLRKKEIEQHNILGDDVVWPSSIDEALADLIGDSE